jgi:3-deoxy-manno-octulosonate cytidylyltransferase (CMP-KDO synthetase)
MKIIGIIPSRYDSTRFPGKPLVLIQGKTMIRRVYEQAIKAKSLNDVIVATDDERIAEEVESFGGKFIYTSPSHQSGTDRCAEVVKLMPGYNVAINIQGDEPYIDPRQIDLLASCFNTDEVQLATLIKEIHSDEELFNINIPKVLVNLRQQAIYFSRHPIPYLRNVEQEQWLQSHRFFKHVGIYGYKVSALLAITKLGTSSLERAESLEQLRWIENGYNIETRITTIDTIAIDHPEDLNKIV